MAQLAEVRNEMLTDEEFERERPEVYAQSPSTPIVDLDEAFEFCRRETRTATARA
jgi:hypothetical protein